MRIRIIAVGRLKERFFKEAVGEYQKRLSRYGQIEIVEVEDERAPERLSPAERDQALHREGGRILARISEGDWVVALCIEGNSLSSEAFAERLAGWMGRGRSSVSFVIGGSLGLAPAVLARADERLSFSPMTFSHQIFRPMLLEQIYRAFRIIRNEPYHK